MTHRGKLCITLFLLNFTRTKFHNFHILEKIVKNSYLQKKKRDEIKIMKFNATLYKKTIHNLERL